MNNILNSFQRPYRSMIKTLKLYNPFDMSKIVNDIKCDTNAILKKLDEESVKIEILEREIKQLRTERRRFKDMIKAIGNTIPDMMWFKDAEGKYLYTNSTIREELFYNLPEAEILGKTDIELAKIFRSKVGDTNHTFGEVCGNSDRIILDKEAKQKFLEWGNINGEKVYLLVHKAPMYEEGILIGTVGTGRDVTELYLNLTELANTNEGISEILRTKIMNILDTYKYSEES